MLEIKNRSELLGGGDGEMCTAAYQDGEDAPIRASEKQQFANVVGIETK